MALFFFFFFLHYLVNCCNENNGFFRYRWRLTPLSHSDDLTYQVPAVKLHLTYNRYFVPQSPFHHLFFALCLFLSLSLSFSLSPLSYLSTPPTFFLSPSPPSIPSSPLLPHPPFHTLLSPYLPAVFVSLRSIIMVELMGLDRLTSAFGLVIMCQGISAFLGAPIAGKISVFQLTRSEFLTDQELSLVDLQGTPR